VVRQPVESDDRQIIPITQYCKSRLLTQHSSISLTADSAIADGVLGTDMPRLLQCDVGQHGKQSTRQTAVCDECCCTARLFSTKVRLRPHHTAAPGPSLVSGYACHGGSNSSSLCLPSVACMVWLCHSLHENCAVWRTWTRDGNFVPLRR